MEPTRVSRSELVGKTQNNTAVLEALVRANALNRTGDIDYNKYGKLDGVGFEKVTAKFVDNFIFANLVPDYNTKKDKGNKLKNIFLPSQNKTIRDLLSAYGIEKPNVKATGMNKVGMYKEEMLQNIPDDNKNKEAKEYYEQIWKIACPNVNYSTVMEFLRKVDYNGYGFFLKDVDVTMDYAGSFDKHKCINHITNYEDFREQGSMQNGEEYPRTVVDNDGEVGKNCLTWMENVDEMKTRQKIYNKMVQMLETKSVRNNVGSHWKDWVCQKGTRLADARDKAKDRGLTRAEVTFYIQDEIPDDEFIEEVLEKIIKYIPKDLVYSTSYAATWESYCDSLKHSLVCIDRSKDIGIIVHSYNETTGNISGQIVENWMKNNKEKWCFDKLTLNGNLPLDLIEVREVEQDAEEEKDDILLEIVGNRYYKVNKDKSTRFTTRLVSNGGIYSCHTGKENVKLLEKAGFVEHENCIPFLARSKDSHTSKADAELRKDENLEVNILNRKEEKKVQKEQFKEKRAEEMLKIEEKTKPLLLEFRKEKEKRDRIEECKWMFCGVETKPLRDIPQGTYTVNAAKKKCNTMYGDQYILSISEHGDNYNVWGNKTIFDKLEAAKDSNHVDVGENLLYLPKEDLGTLIVTGKGNAFNGHRQVYCKLLLNGKEKEEKKQFPIHNVDIVTPVIPREDLLPYKDYPNLTALDIGSVHNVDGWGYVKHYGTERLVISISGKIYQAGENLEENVIQLKHLCKIKIEKIRLNKKRRVKYAICSIYEKGDWTAFLDYGKMEFLPNEKIDGDTYILDVRTVDVKGNKRKLLLTKRDEEEQAVVYRLKKPKLEEKIKIGMI